MKFSVLMSVYAKELPENLRQSLASIFDQELPPDEVVLVEDGQLTEALSEVVIEFWEQHKELHVIRLVDNLGLGQALERGMNYCKYDIVARMDSDDISRRDRFSKEMFWLENHPDTDVVGSWVDEFQGDPSEIISTRRLPEAHRELMEFSRYRNPMNHPTVMFRKEAVMKAGGYRHCPLFEDYDLWVRMLLSGARFHNLQESLLYFRMTPQMFSRRGGSHYIQQEIGFQKRMHHMGHIGWRRMMANCIVRVGMRLVPNSWRKYGYLIFLRK
jgi:glycosyltransferase involved in cell wall biosynthesis